VKRRGCPQGLRITAHVADVSDAAQVERFRDESRHATNTDRIHLFIQQRRHRRRRQHDRKRPRRVGTDVHVCWGGVYYSTRAFLPMLQKAEEGHIVNTSSINRFLGVPRATRSAHRL